MPYIRSQTIGFVVKNGEFPRATVDEPNTNYALVFGEKLDDMSTQNGLYKKINFHRWLSGQLNLFTNW